MASDEQETIAVDPSVVEKIVLHRKTVSTTEVPKTIVNETKPEEKDMSDEKLAEVMKSIEALAAKVTDLTSKAVEADKAKATLEAKNEELKVKVAELEKPAPKALATPPAPAERLSKAKLVEILTKNYRKGELAVLAFRRGALRGEWTGEGAYTYKTRGE